MNSFPTVIIICNSIILRDFQRKNIVNNFDMSILKGSCLILSLITIM